MTETGQKLGQQPTQQIKIDPMATLESCPTIIQFFVGEVIREVRGTTRGRRNFSMELSAMQAIANETGLDPTKTENRDTIASLRIEKIRDQVVVAVRAALPPKKGKKAVDNPAQQGESPIQEPEPRAETAKPDVPAEPPVTQPAITLDPQEQPNTEPPAPEEPEPSLSQSILAELIKTTKPDEEVTAKIKSTIEELNGEQLQQLIAELKKTRKNLQKIIDTVRDECVKKRPQETDITADQALTHPEQVKNCFTFRNLANNPDLPVEQQIALLKSGIKLAKEEEIITATIDMLIRLGEIYRRNGRIDEALETFEEILRLQAETHHQKPENIKRTIAVITELKTPVKNGVTSTPAEATSTPPPAPDQPQQPKKLEVTLPAPRTPENVLRACHNLATDKKFDEGEAMADKAMRHFTTDDRFEMQKIGFQATKMILAKPSIISSLQTRQLIAASFTLERAKELELAIKCLKELLARNISLRARETCTERITKISAELAAQRKSQSQPAAQPTTVPAPAPAPVHAPAPAPAPLPKPEKLREKSQAEIASETASKLIAYLEGLEQQSKKWKRAEGDSVLIIPEEKIEGLTEQLGKILETKELLYAEHIGQTGRTNLEGMIEKGKGFLQSVRSGQLKIRLLKQIPAELELIK